MPCLSTSDKIAFQLCHAVFLAYSSPSVTLCSAVERRNRRCVTASLPVGLSDMVERIYRRPLSPLKLAVLLLGNPTFSVHENFHVH